MKFISRDTALAPGREAAAALAEQPGPFRVYSPSYSLPMQTAAAFNLHLADGVEPVHLAVVDQFMARAGGYGDPGFSVTIPHFDGPPESALRDVQPSLKLLGLLNVKYLAAEFPMAWEGLAAEAQIGRTFIYRNRLALPRAWVAYQTQPVQSDWLGQLESLPDVQAVVLTEGDAPTLNTPRPASAAEVTHFAPDRIRLAAATDGPGWLVLSEIWYPGWTAVVDGAPVPVARVDGLLRGVYLPNAGAHNISLEYRPASVIWGGRLAWATLLAIVAAAGIWAARATFRPKNP
ncbi:MAG: hypothetical protein D6768_10550 [Chloroflexi bacterium]|nr:MAG: hypothetical protein D6768_10550 [Chloroflexota bacterium]